ncbi:MAG: hypothetical protein AAF915_14350 [Cyanobacteria bacterium P01_D01_bin.50]
MSKLTKDYLVPISTVLINGALAYFINQLPSIRADSQKVIPVLSNISIYIFTAICVVLVYILTIYAKESQQKSIQSNINS